MSNFVNMYTKFVDVYMQYGGWQPILQKITWQHTVKNAAQYVTLHTT